MKLTNEKDERKTKKIKEMYLSDQALGTLMMALQKSLMEQSDIVPILKSFKLAENDSGELVVLNPPLVKVSHEDLDILEAAGGIYDKSE